MNRGPLDRSTDLSACGLAFGLEVGGFDGPASFHSVRAFLLVSYISSATMNSAILALRSPMLLGVFLAILSAKGPACSPKLNYWQATW